MTLPIEYNLSVIGQRDVDRAFLALEQRVAQHVKRVEQLTGLHGRGGVGGVANDRGLGRSNINQEAQQQRMRERGLANAARAREAYIKSEERAEEKASRSRIRMVEREEKEKARLRERGMANSAKAREKYIKEEERTAARLHKAEERAALRSAHDSGAARLGIVRSIGGTLGSIGRAGIALTGLGGGALAANAVHDQMRAEKMAAGLGGKIAGRGASEAQIRAARDKLLIDSASVKGMKQDQVMGMAEGFGALTGDYAAGGRMAADLGKLSLATGADPTELAKVAGNVQMKLKTTLSGKDLEAAVMESTRLFAGQGEMGAVDIKDFATYAGRITATASMFSGNRERNMGSLGAIAQAAIGSGSASSAEEATSSVARLGSDIMTKRKEVEKLGIKAFDGDKLKAPEELLTEIITKTGGNMSKLDPLFGMMSIRPVLGLSSVYSDAEAKKKGSGKQALSDYFEGMRRGGFTKEDINRRANVINESPELILQESMKKLNVAIGKELLPVFTRFTQKMGDAAPQVGRLAESVASAANYLMSNPWSGVGIAVSGAITKSIVDAGIASVMKTAMEGAMGKGLGALSVGVAAFTITTATLQLMDAAFDTGKKTEGRVSTISSGVDQDFGIIDDAVAAGKITPEQALEKKQDVAKAAREQLQEESGKRGLWTTMTGGGEKALNMAFGDISAKLDAAAKNLNTAADALKAGAGTGGGGVGGKPNQGGHPTWYGAPMSQEQ